MSRVAYFDASAGASGDMLLGALVDLGLPLGDLRAELAKLPFGGHRLEARVVQKTGLRATKLDVIVEHAHGHAHGRGQDHAHEHSRGLREIVDGIEKSALADEVKARAVELFRRL